MINKTLMAAGALALFLPMSVQAQTTAQDLTVTGKAGEPELQSRMVRLGDLDLRQDKDVRVADSRIRRAAANVCGVGRMNGSVIAPQESGCYNDAFSRARVDLNSVIADRREG